MWDGKRLRPGRTEGMLAGAGCPLVGLQAKKPETTWQQRRQRQQQQQQQQQRDALRRVIQWATLGDSSVSSRVTDVALVFVTLSSDYTIGTTVTQTNLDQN